MIQGKKFYSIDEVAEMLGVTYQLIYKLVRSGELGALRVGKVYRITEDDLNAYLDNQRKNVKKEAAAMTCSVCGKRYHSRLSITGECKVCGLPICRNCVELDGAQYCEIHQKENPKNTEKK